MTTQSYRDCVIEECAEVVRRRRGLLDPGSYYEEREELKIVENAILALKTSPLLSVQSDAPSTPLGDL